MTRDIQFILLFFYHSLTANFKIALLKYHIHSEISHLRLLWSRLQCGFFNFQWKFLIRNPTAGLLGQHLLPCMCCSHGFHMEQIAKFSLVRIHVSNASVTAVDQSRAGVCLARFLGTVVLVWFVKFFSLESCFQAFALQSGLFLISLNWLALNETICIYAWTFFKVCLCIAPNFSHSKDVLPLLKSNHLLPCSIFNPLYLFSSITRMWARVCFNIPRNPDFTSTETTQIKEQETGQYSQ